MIEGYNLIQSKEHVVESLEKSLKETKESKVKSIIEKLEVKKNDSEESRLRIDSFKKFLSQDKILEEFNKDFFRMVIDHVVIGDFDKKGNADPYIIDFVYKNGLVKRQKSSPLVIRNYAQQNADTTACREYRSAISKIAKIIKKNSFVTFLFWPII